MNVRPTKQISPYIFRPTYTFLFIYGIDQHKLGLVGGIQNPTLHLSNSSKFKKKKKSIFHENMMKIIIIFLFFGFFVAKCVMIEKYYVHDIFTIFSSQNINN